uniref:Putative product n=1 Tax=Xenopsylla cheopis TaxID=163159 RepID=A0A6M2DXZ2_XENCH
MVSAITDAHRFFFLLLWSFARFVPFCTLDTPLGHFAVVPHMTNILALMHCKFLPLYSYCHFMRWPCISLIQWRAFKSCPFSMIIIYTGSLCCFPSDVFFLICIIFTTFTDLEVSSEWTSFSVIAGLRPTMVTL